MGVFAWFRRKAKDTVTAGSEAVPEPAPAVTEEPAGEAAGTAAEGSAGTAGVEIPKQQSAEAADSEAGEGART
ncbi:hypothetical protein LG634_02630 [Streptomyces bambusae]|uniref:hypothetical protein n=1 Tax=Streptomyces bambusae TaxID=1550616 RepID=UPI001CFD5F38|nr:hypothetical protein [Streptomyces bambusae]MCB5163740.1 hypothetical protein [Streptomyces bambusae]